MRTNARSRGFTLLELLVGAAVGAVVLLGISLTFISQAQQYQAHASRRGVQANARQALAFMGRQLRMAGYGVNPDRAIIAYDAYNAATNLAEAGYPDAFVVHWRDPVFRRVVQAADPNRITLKIDPTVPPALDQRPLQEPLRKGQILLLICGKDTSNPMAGESLTHAFVTVNQFTPAGSTEIFLDATPPNTALNSPIAGPGRLFHEQAELTRPCFSSPTQPAQLVLINRAAFYVAMFDDMEVGRTPYLMMHQGLDMPSATDVPGDGVIDANDAVPVAEGIEQMQVAYILNTDNDAPPIIRGVNEPMNPARYGEQWEAIDPIELPTGWLFRSPYDMPGSTTLEQKRLMDHPANIRQVRLTLVSRSSVPDSQIAGDDLLLKPDGTPYPDGAPLPNGTVPWRHLENLGTPAQDFTPRGGGFYRVMLREAITPKNLLLTRQFIPINKGGG